MLFGDAAAQIRAELAPELRAARRAVLVAGAMSATSTWWTLGEPSDSTVPYDAARDRAGFAAEAVALALAVERELEAAELVERTKAQARAGAGKGR